MRPETPNQVVLMLCSTRTHAQSARGRQRDMWRLYLFINDVILALPVRIVITEVLSL